MRVSAEIANLVPYKPGKPISEAQREYGIQNMIKLASNENCIGLSPKVTEALQLHLKDQFRYPDPSCYELIQTLSRVWKVPPEQLGIGNGSNEVIDLLVRIFCAPRQAILTSESAFVAYAVCAKAARVNVLTTPLRSDLTMDLSAMAQILRQDHDQKIRLVFLPNPNNPTGTYLRRAEVDAFLKEFGRDPERLIVFDEAYNEYVRASDYQSVQKIVSQDNNVVVVRTLSKVYGLAGLRIGVLVAPPFVLDYFNRVRNPFNVNDLAQVAAIAALQDTDFLLKSVQVTWQGLDYFYQELTKLSIPFLPSEGNFVLLDTQKDATQVNESLLRKGLILRPVGNYGLKTYLRMTVGKPDENEFAIRCLQQVLRPKTGAHDG